MTLRERKERANKESLVSEEHQELFHYTSLHALEGILETNTLWATHAHHLNDSSEMKLLWPELESKCIAYLNKAFEDGPGRNPEVKKMTKKQGDPVRIGEMDGPTIMGIMKSLLFGDESRAGMGIPFVASFTTHKKEYQSQNGMLSQWRGYGDDQGVAIVFDAARLDRLLESESCRFVYLCCSIEKAVYYKNKLNLKVHFPELFDALQGYSKDHVGRVTNNENSENSESSDAVVRHLLPAVGRLKHRAFHEEKEHRVIIGVFHESYSHEIDQSELAGQKKNV